MNESGPKEGGEELVREILGYLIQFPGSKDSVEGVRQWWIAKGQANYQRAEVEEVLERLVERGWVTKRPPAESLYSLNGERIAEIQQFLGEQDTNKDHNA